jgi:hypothetical protein
MDLEMMILCKFFIRDLCGLMALLEPQMNLN